MNTTLKAPKKGQSLEARQKEVIEAQKNDFLLNALTIANDQLKLAQVFTPTYEGSSEYHFMASHANEIGENIAKLINGRYHDMRLYIQNDAENYSFDLRAVETLLKDLKTELNRDWKKYKTEKQSDWSTKVVLIAPNTSLPKEHELNPKNWQGIAELFDSAAEIVCSDEYIQAENNYLNACQALETMKTGETKYTPTGPADIKKQEKLVSFFKEFYEAWQGINKVAQGIDYVALAEWKKENELDELANNNEAIEAIKEPFEALVGYFSKRAIYDLFKENNLEPSNDLNLLVSLYAAKEINEDVKEIIWNDEVTERLKHKEVKKYKDFDHYLNELKQTYEKELAEFNDKYRLKKTGMYKSVSHRERERRDNKETDLERQNTYISYLIKNELTIKKYLK